MYLELFPNPQDTQKQNHHMSTTLPSRGWGRRIAVISNPAWVQSFQDIRATQWDPPCLKLGYVWNVLLTLSSYIQFSFLIFKRLLPSKLTNSMKTLWLPMYGHDCLGDYKEKKTVIQPNNMRCGQRSKWWNWSHMHILLNGTLGQGMCAVCDRYIGNASLSCDMCTFQVCAVYS